MENRQENELKIIAYGLSGILTADEIEHVKVGEYEATPDVIGCFKRNDEWFAYQNDERVNCTITGPFDIKGVVIAIAKKMYKKGLKFEDEQQKTNYINNHFRNVDEIDSYQRAK